MLFNLLFFSPKHAGGKIIMAGGEYPRRRTHLLLRNFHSLLPRCRGVSRESKEGKVDIFPNLSRKSVEIYHRLL